MGERPGEKDGIDYTLAQGHCKGNSEPRPHLLIGIYMVCFFFYCPCLVVQQALPKLKFKGGLGGEIKHLGVGWGWGWVEG
jgi:hypothetical protein